MVQDYAKDVNGYRVDDTSEHEGPVPSVTPPDYVHSYERDGQGYRIDVEDFTAPDEFTEPAPEPPVEDTAEEPATETPVPLEPPAEDATPVADAPAETVEA